MEFPANSNKTKESAKPKVEKKEVEKVVTGEVIEKKKPLGRRFKDIFLGADFKGASAYIVADVLFPAVRNMVVDATTKGIERFVYGDTAPRGRHQPGRPRTTYNAPVDRSRGRSMMLPDQPPYSRQQQRRPEANDIVLVSREEAEAVLEGLRDIIDKYEVASIADFHDLVGLPTSYVDNKWGWTNLSYVEARQVREGYLIDLPHAEPL